MATYDSQLTGIQVDNAIDAVLNDSAEATYGHIKGNVTDNTAIKAALTDVKEDKANVVSKGSATVPVYMDGSGVATPITSYAGTAARATADASGANIVDTYAKRRVLKDLTNVNRAGENELIKADRVWTNYTGILDDAEGKADVEAMKRSTFRGYTTDETVATEKNLFYAVVPEEGRTLSITDDGIASGFSGSNYINIPLTLDKPFKMTFYETLTNVKNLILGTNSAKFVIDSESDRYRFYVNDSVSVMFVTPITNELLKFEVIWDGSIYTLNVYRSNGTLYCTCTLNSTNSIGSINLLTYSAYFGKFVNGSIYLKQFSITVDGVEVFNGNKTGIDQIKKDDYTIYPTDGTSTVVVSDDGIASGFSSSNYLKKYLTITNENTLKLEVEFDYNSLDVYQRILYFNSSQLRIMCNEGGTVGAHISSGTNIRAVNKSTLGNPQDGSLIKVILELTSTTADFWVYVDGILKYHPEKKTGQSYDIASTLMQIGAYGSEYFRSSIDLNSFKIYVDDKLVYQPTLRIPYYKTATGCKVVDAAYRDRVEDAAEQYGYANYYTKLSGEQYHVTKVGSPTLSGGIASGFSGSTYGNHLKLPSDIRIYGNTWEISMKLNVDGNTGGTILVQEVSDGFASSKINFTAWNDNKIYLQLGNGSQTQDCNGTDTHSGIVYTKIGRKNNKYYLKTSNDGIIYKEENSVDVIYEVDIKELSIGSSNSDYFGGSIDLSQFIISVDGKEVYRAYENNTYTLPKGENLNGHKAIVAYTDTYRADTDLNLEQVGTCTANTAVTFPKAFKDANYSLTCPYTNKTATGFTPTQTGDYIAIGKVTLDELYKQ